MVQILWKSKAPHSAKQDHELIELRLVDLGKTAGLRYLVREIRAGWSSSDQTIEWRGYEDHAYGTPQEAQRSFDRLRASMRKAGFSHTTVLA